MRERDDNTRELDDYWQHDLAIGEARFWRDEYTVRLKVHESTETHSGRLDLLPQRTYRGDKLYFHAKPYILLPDISLSVGLYEKPQGPNIGEVRDVRWEGMRHQEVGQAQAWYLGGDLQTLELWEAYIEEPHRQKDPTQDPALAMVWQGFEGFLLDRLQGVERIITPAWEPVYPVKWPEFLEQMGYRRLSNQAFEKQP